MEKIIKASLAFTSEDLATYMQGLLDRQTADIIEKVQHEIMETENKSLSKFGYSQEDSEEKSKEQSKLIDSLNRQIEDKDQALSELRSLIAKKTSECKESDFVKQKIQHELEEKEKQVIRLEDRIQHYVNNYGELEAVYSIFTALTEDTLNRLDNVFEKKDFLSFLKAGFQWENIEGLWNCTRRKVIEENEIDTEQLIKIFLFFFSVYNSSGNTADYYIIQPTVGEKYNREQHSILGKETDGYVKQVRLPGYRDRKGKVHGKALIKV